ncbi:hypothetical protein B484DRAFT_440911, partial [Ochromonadaceae sp. CCMP2298]
MRDQQAHRASGGMVAAIAAEGSGAAQMDVVAEWEEGVEEADMVRWRKMAEALCRIQFWSRRCILRRKWADRAELVRLMALRILCWMRRMRRARVAGKVSIRREWMRVEKPVSSVPAPVPPSGSSSSGSMEVGDAEVEVVTQQQLVVAGKVYELKGVDESYHPFVDGAVARYVFEWESAQCLRGILEKKAFNLTKKTKTAKTFVPPKKEDKWIINETGYAACVRCLNERPGCLFAEVVVNGRNGKEMLNHRKGRTCAAKLPVTYQEATGAPSKKTGKKRMTRTTPTELVTDLKLGTDWIYFDFPGLLGDLYRSGGKDVRSAATTATFDWNVGGTGTNALAGWYH